MKKILTTVVSLIMAAVMVMFVGCGGDGKETGVIKGNYKEATAEDVAIQLNNVDTDNLLGDMTAEDWATALSVYFDLNAEGQGVKTAVNFKYDLSMAQTETGMALKGKGSLSASTSGSTDEEDNMAVEGNIYNDEGYIYIDLGEASKVKISLENFVEMIGSLIGELTLDADAAEPGTDDDSEAGFDFSETIKGLAEMGIKFEMDTSDGLKLKVIVTSEIILDLIGNMMAAEVPGLTDVLKTCVVEFYLHIDKDSHLVAVTARVDVDLDMGETLGAYSFDAVMAVRVTKPSTIKLPEGIAQDETYIESDGMM